MPHPELVDRNRAIVHARLVDDRELADIAREHGISRQRVHRILRDHGAKYAPPNFLAALKLLPERVQRKLLMGDW